MISEDAVKTTELTTYAFAEFRLETENLLLLSDSEVVPLAPKACEVLLALVEAGGKLLTKQQILDKVWADTFVEEANLTHHISALRKALGEDKNGRKFIETIPRRGYRFVAPIIGTNKGAVEIVFSERVTERLVEEIETGVEPPVERQLPPVFAPKNRPARNKWAVAGVVCILVVVLSGVAFYQFAARRVEKDSSRHNFAPVSYTRVSDGKDVGCATISPDGKFVAYIQNYNVGEGGTLYIRQLETNREIRLIEPDERTFGNVDFSPDGSLIYYISFEKAAKRSALYSISILGGKPKRILSLDWASAFFAVSPDGKQVAFYRNDEEAHTTSLIITALDDPSGQEQIVHTHPSAEPSFWGQLAWSPDGQSLAVIRVQTSDTQYDSRIYKFDLQTREAAQMHDEGFAEIGKLRFNPNGRELFFVGRTDTSTQKIYALDVASRQIRRVTNDTNGYGNYGLGITADGKTLAVDLTETKGDLWSAAADGNLADATRIKPGETNGRRGLAVLADNRIAYVARVSDKYDIWSIKSDGTDVQPLTNDVFEERNLTASRDGRFIVFASDRRAAGAGKHLYRMNADGSDLKQLTFGDTKDAQPDFSPDGSWIVYISEESGSTTVRKIPVEGGTPIQLTDYFASNPTFSPDGAHIAVKFLSGSRSQPGEIAVIPASGGKPEKTFPVTDFEFFVSVTPIRWTPDAAGIIFRRERNSIGNLWQQNLDGSPPRQITHFTSDTIYDFAYSGDGKRILFSRGLYQTNSVLIQNFNAE